MARLWGRTVGCGGLLPFLLLWSGEHSFAFPELRSEQQEALLENTGEQKSAFRGGPAGLWNQASRPRQG